MRNVLIAASACLLSVVVPAPARAKRAAPNDVPPVRVGDVEYRAPHFPIEHMGFVDAHDAKTGRLIWSRQIYVVVKNPELEGDVQDIFITRLQREGDDALVVTNESGSVYRLDLKTLDVKVEKGAVRQQR